MTNRFLDRLMRWRLEHGILTGRWTEQEISDQRRRAHERYLRLQRRFD